MKLQLTSYTAGCKATETAGCCCAYRRPPSRLRLRRRSSRRSEPPRRRSWLRDLLRRRSFFSRRSSRCLLLLRDLLRRFSDRSSRSRPLGLRERCRWCLLSFLSRSSRGASRRRSLLRLLLRARGGGCAPRSSCLRGGGCACAGRGRGRGEPQGGLCYALPGLCPPGRRSDTAGTHTRTTHHQRGAQAGEQQPRPVSSTHAAAP